jgi:hypothetical protein
MSNRLRFSLLAAAATAGLFSAGSVSSAQNIGINFSGRDNNDVAPDQTAGVVPQTNYNNADGNAGTLLGLVGANGATTGATVTWNTPHLWNTDDESNTSQFANPGDENLMKGYLDVFEGETGSITVSGLAPGLYDVYVYSLTAVDGRDSGNIVVEGIQEKSISIISTAFQEGGGPGGDDNLGGNPGNYNRYSNLNLSDGQLDIALTGQTFRTAVNGIQIVAVPEPAGLGLLGAGALGLLARRRRA